MFIVYNNMDDRSKSGAYAKDNETSNFCQL